MTETYIKLKDAENLMRLRIDWTHGRDAINARNECLEILSEAQSIDVSDGCEVCAGEYDQYIAAFVTRNHTSSDSTTKVLTCNFCPVCGARIR